MEKLPSHLDKDNKIEYFANSTAVLVSKHKKEEAIAPVLQQLNWQLEVYPLDTDQFGTFSGEIPRQGSPLDAARRKIKEAQQQHTQGTVWLASEGSFGPHPEFPFLPMDHELILCYDAENDLEIIGEAIATDTNYAREAIKSWNQLEEFARAAGFPAHGIILKGDKENSTTKIIKDILDPEGLKKAYYQLQDFSVLAETDMRAMYNPKRMKVIASATENLVQKINSCCPECGTQGFWVKESISGLPCEWCGQPTQLILRQIYECKKCGHRQEKNRADGKESADPMYCNFCNP